MSSSANMIGAASIVLKSTSAIRNMNGGFTSVVSVYMVNDKGTSYWCFKGRIMAAVFAIASRMMSSSSTVNLKDYFIAFKCGDNPESIEVTKKGLNAETYGSTVIVYALCDFSKESLNMKIMQMKDVIQDIVCNEKFKTWVDYYIAHDESKDKLATFRSKMMEDDKFWKSLSKNKPLYEHDCALNTFLTYDSIERVIKWAKIADGHVDTWSTDVKSAAFGDGVVPTYYHK